MRIAIILPRIDQLGPVKVIQALVNLLYQIKQLQVTVFYLDKTVDSKIKMMVPVERLDRKRFRFSDYDVIHTNGIRPDLYAFLNRKKIKCHIVTVHNFVFDDLFYSYNRLISFFFGFAWMILWCRADKLVFVSNAMKKYYSRWFSSSKLEVIHNGIAETNDFSECDTETINAISNFRSRGLNVIGSAGILTKRKGIDQILQILAEYNDLSLVIIGNGKELENLQKLACKLNITDRCLFCGFISNAVTYFRNFDLFMIPSRSEGFGLVLVEAIQQRVPVICSDLEVFMELFDTSEVTFFKLDDISSLKSAVKTLKDRNTVKTESAYSRYLNEYTDKYMADRYFELYKSIVNENH